MKTFKLLFIAFLLLCCTCVQINAQITAVYPEVYAVDSVPGYTTYRIFAEMDNGEDHIMMLFANPNGAFVEIGGTGNVIWNHELGAMYGNSIQTQFCFLEPLLCYDSFLTIGVMGDQFYDGSPVDCNPWVTEISFADSLVNSMANTLGVNFYSEEGAMVALPGSCNSYGIGENYKVFLAQVTIPNEDEIFYTINLGVRIGDTTENVMYYGHPGVAETQEEGAIDGAALGLKWPMGNCLDPLACNFDYLPGSAQDDIFCDYSCYGCMDPEACNYDSLATMEGTCLIECPGCTDSTADNYDFQANVEDGSCEYWGCMDTAADNYDSQANVDDNCEYWGCTVSWAENYELGANVNDGSCELPISGFAFIDENLDGIYNDDDYPLAFQTITLNPGNLTIITDDFGFFDFGIQPEGDYSLTAGENSQFPFFTTVSEYAINNDNLEASQYFNFGYSAADPQYGFTLNFQPAMSEYPCNGESIIHNIDFRNMGTTTVSGIIQVDYDELFAGYIEMSEIDSVVGNSIFMSFENQLPGQMFFYDVKLTTPDVDALGEFLISTATVYAMDGLDVLASMQDVLELEVTCSYDPNDKQVFPPGYSDEHYIFADTELEYLVRFQNVGNAPAQTVLIRDTIDDNLDISSFALVANSHSVMTTIDGETREVQFLFDNIMLPDSVSDEPGSHGLVSYKIRPYETLDFGAVIENTGYIYFDSNPPITTNTTWNTIYECLEAQITEDGAILTASEGSEWQWFLDGVAIDGATEQFFEITAAGVYTVQITDEMGCTDLSEGVTITSLDDFESQVALMFPNPMTNNTSLLLTEGIYNVKITDNQGRIIRSYLNIAGGNLTISRDELTSGVYHVLITNTDNLEGQSMQLVVQ